MSSDTPERIGQYEILRPVGRGAMGVLYHARDSVSGREVALKVMSADTLEDEDARARFHHEARLAVRVQHRNIVKVFEFGEDGDVPFIAMEFLRGQSLSDRLNSGAPMPIERRLDIVIQVCEGLQCLHEQGIVHRDVKPANIWLLEDGGVKLLDLGIAKHAGVKLTQYGNVVGSAAYMAPEQLSGLPVDGRADIFGAGVVLYELLSGQKPFQAESITAVMMKVLHEPAPDIRALVPDLSEDLVQALDLALQKDPAQRYMEAADLGSDLRLARDAADIPANPLSAAVAETAERSEQPLEPTIVAKRVLVTPVTGAATLPASVPVPPADPDPVLRDEQEVARIERAVPPPPAGAASGRRPMIWAGAAVLALVAVAGGWFAMTRPPEDPEYRLDVRSTPAGADILVDGATTGQRTPAVVTLVARPARIGLALRGYEPVDDAVAATADPTMSLTYTLRRILQVHSEPPGARIVVEGRDTGLVTPASLPLAEPYPADIELQLKGHLAGRHPVTAAVLEKGLLSMTLTTDTPAPAGPTPTGRPSSRPQVAVTVSGTYRFAVSGCGANAPAAERHVLKVTAPCTLRLRAPEFFLDAMRSVTAVAGGQVDLTAPPVGTVQLRSRHQDCTLHVNGRAVGSPPADVRIAAGSYSATLQCPDGQTLQTRTFEVAPGDTVRRIDDYLR